MTPSKTSPANAHAYGLRNPKATRFGDVMDMSFFPAGIERKMIISARQCDYSDATVVSVEEARATYRNYKSMGFLAAPAYYNQVEIRDHRVELIKAKRDRHPNRSTRP